MERHEDQLRPRSLALSNEKLELPTTVMMPEVDRKVPNLTAVPPVEPERPTTMDVPSLPEPGVPPLPQEEKRYPARARSAPSYLKDYEC